MNNQNLLIYESQILYEILIELSDHLNFKVVNISKKELNNSNLGKYDDYLILSLKEKLNTSNQILSLQFPIKFSKLLEKINLHFLRQKFSKQSKINVGRYLINTNSREIILDKLKLKLTEKEINTILYLNKSEKPVSINELQDKVWGYQSELETHTVETHIYRLRKKIIENFSDNQFILSDKNGYFLMITPFLVRVHEVPIDCNRWTEDGMKYFLNDCGFKLENIFTNSWGNKKCVISDLRTDDTWTRVGIYRDMSNNKLFPLQVWALAKKD